ncbi:unnamed protein product [Polarella glacialis]|uniref:Uncharacterized protein n=1 Tax=Polarella glacialis TaxID=89957 RepID=A0A813DSV9_POLGL|nr:unnamed protein product [Polarella glacialis]
MTLSDGKSGVSSLASAGRALLSLLILSRATPGAGDCSEGPHVNWTAVREDLVTYSTLSEPSHRSRRCFGLDSGVWSYCGISAMRILQMQPGLINDATTNDPESPLTMSAAALQAKSPCGLGSVCIGFYAMTFLTPGERHGMLFWEADRLDKLGLSFEEILATEWPLFGLLARLAEEVILSGSARPVDATCHGAASPSSEATQRLVVALREEVAQRVAQRRPVPEALARRILAAVERAGDLV